jgi:hypothetical protein
VRSLLKLEMYFLLRTGEIRNLADEYYYRIRCIRPYLFIGYKVNGLTPKGVALLSVFSAAPSLRNLKSQGNQNASKYSLYGFSHFCGPGPIHALFCLIRLAVEMTSLIRLIPMAALSLIMSAFTGHAQTVQAQVATSASFKPPIPITSLPLTITSSGYYYLVSDTYYNPISLTNRIAITVLSPGVTIDLRGHSLTGPFQAEITVPEYFNLNPVAILIESSNVTVKNGTISGFFFQLEAGPSSGNVVPTYLSNIIITDVKFTDGGDWSMSLGNVNNSIISNCTFGYVPLTTITDGGSQTGNRYINDTFSGNNPISLYSQVPMILNIQPKANDSRN